MVVLVLILVISGVTVGSASIIAAGGVAGVTIAALEQDLPDVRAFEDLGFAEPTIIYDRSGKHELARFWEERRRVVEFDEIPKLILDVTTAVEDDTFWDNPGFDLEATLNAFASDVAGSSDRGGASTITQQLVRARLLPKEVLDADDTQEGLYLRKAKELIQAFKLTQAYPGEDGKRAIITAYLNEIFYGANAYGVAAAANVYFGKRLGELSVSEAALLAGLPQEPANLDPFKFARRVKLDRKRHGRRLTRLEVRTCAPYDVSVAPEGTVSIIPRGDCRDIDTVVRRNYILGRLADGKGRWTELTAEQLKAALNEKIVLKKPRAVRFDAPHFVWAMRSELDAILADREPITRGGYRVLTTLDMRAQRLGEKYVEAGARVPNLSGSAYYQAITQLGLRQDSGWISRLRGANIRNGALVALDYRTGDILAYVGSAGYYRKKSPRFDPRYDHAGQGRRQPGSSWKPIVYATGIDSGALTAGSVVLDITTPFGAGWTPKDADRLERGPILVREALMYSLNIPAIRALDRVGVRTVRKYATKAGLTFINGPQHLDQAGLAGAIGTVEVKPLEMTAAFGAFGNGGKVTRPRYVLRVEDSRGNVIYKAGDPVTTQVWSPQAAYIMADILSGNTNPAENTIWGPRFQLTNGPGGVRRTAALKTGTTNDLLDFSTYGFLPIPQNPKQPALAVGVWFGNSDHSRPTVPASNPIFSSDNAGEAWHSFLRDYMKGKPLAEFERPKGVVTATIDKYSGGAPGAWTRGTIQEMFVRGTQPGGRNQVDPPGLLYSKGCGAFLVQPLRAENPGAPASWQSAVNGWAARAAVGGGTGRYGTAVTYMYGKSSFGGPVATGTGCYAPPPTAETEPDDTDSGGGRSGGGGGPAPTCQPGSTTKPPGCWIPAPEG